ncbi:hypothetical protein [Alicyclobacillus sp.]|uniref:hypothetical protein n=1 Tax=Alicyclobacillus sp. TaxID=61169 RepID=UPI0025C445B2|nr:hypothetical protein [Alicyclobacillus sp.]MCL6517282.1 hypothetical protein [Alicyclobacillus sp.]
MCTRAECEKYVGKWVGFRTKYGYHVGLIERVTPNAAIVLSPRQYIPKHVTTLAVSASDVEKLDLALAWGGFGGAPGAGYGGWGGWGWGWGWGRWAVAFLIIYVLWGLWWW